MRFPVAFLFAVLAIASVPVAAQTTYDAGLATAIAKNDVRLCGEIDQDRVVQDYVLHPPELQEQCRIGFAVAQKDPDGCLALSNTPAPGSISSRHQCLNALANATRKPELCEKIEAQTPTDSLFYRDRCRAGAITDIRQCSEGFHATSWGDTLNDRTHCIDQIARNAIDPSLCQLHALEKDKRLCEQTVGALKNGLGPMGSQPAPPAP